MICGRVIENGTGEHLQLLSIGKTRRTSRLSNLASPQPGYHR